MRINALLSFVLLVGMSVGCTPKVNVVKVSTHNQNVNGIRYYRPKPYLLITPVSQVVKTEAAKQPTITTTSPGPKYVNLKLEYLPDFNEEYAIQVSPGLGTADVTLTLEDGWKLVDLGQDLDSNFDDNVKAVTGAVEAASKLFIPTPGVSAAENKAASSPSMETVVQASNVPIGYYESVIGFDARGKKQMYGWRYLGFMPFANCPPDVCGRGQPEHCETICLYGLVFRNDVMEFRKIGDLDSNGAHTRLPQSGDTYLAPETVTVKRNLKSPATETHGGREYKGEYLISDNIEVAK